MKATQEKQHQLASTGPRSGERGDPVTDLLNEDTACGFNGAALRRARR